MRTPEEIGQLVFSSTTGRESVRVLPWDLAAYVAKLVRERDAEHAAVVRLLARECKAWRDFEWMQGGQIRPHDDPERSCQVCTACAATDAAGIDLADLAKEGT